MHADSGTAGAGNHGTGAVVIRDATLDDWPAIWSFMQRIVSAGETFSWDRDLTQDQARDIWFRWRDDPRGHTVVAVAPGGTVTGTAEMGPNHGGPASHIASASFMVSPEYGRRGIGRALGAYVLERARADGFRGMKFNAVVESNVGAVALWRELGFDVVATIPEGFRHPEHGYVGLHIMYQAL